jgi:hypothetical protein
MNLETAFSSIIIERSESSALEDNLIQWRQLEVKKLGA